MHIRKIIILIAMQISLPVLAEAAEDIPFNYVPKDGVIPDQETAVQVADAILRPIYGSNQIRKEEPFTAVLKGDVWTITGTMPKGDILGGGAILEISRSKGCVIRISHGQ